MASGSAVWPLPCHLCAEVFSPAVTPAHLQRPLVTLMASGGLCQRPAIPPNPPFRCEFFTGFYELEGAGVFPLNQNSPTSDRAEPPPEAWAVGAHQCAVATPPLTAQYNYHTSVAKR